MNPTTIEVSVISETFNLTEGAEWDRFRASLRAALAMIPADQSEVLVADVSDSQKLAEMLARDFPNVRRIVATGDGYEAAKTRAALAASGRYLLYLDSDCIPAEDWHHRMLAALRSGHAVAYGGHVRYAGGFIAAIMSVMDFGYLYPTVARDLACYASNNSAFLRSALLDCPAPGGDVRCTCFAHAQRLLREGTPVRFVPDARVLHALPPVVRERTRQGYDMIQSRCDAPALPQARWLRLGILSIPLFYGLSILLDWKRMSMARQDVTLPYWQWVGSFFCFPVFRLLDVAGMLYWHANGPTKGGWGGGRIRQSDKLATP